MKKTISLVTLFSSITFLMLGLLLFLKPDESAANRFRNYDVNHSILVERIKVIENELKELKDETNALAIMFETLTLEDEIARSKEAMKRIEERQKEHDAKRFRLPE